MRYTGQVLKDFHAGSPVYVEVYAQAGAAGHLIELRHKGQRIVLDLEQLEQSIDEQVEE